MSKEEIEALLNNIINLPVPYREKPLAGTEKKPVAKPPAHNHITGADLEAAPMINIHKIEEVPRLKVVDNLPQTVEIPEAKPVSQIRNVAHFKMSELGHLVWRSSAILVGLCIYLAAVANNVYSAWSLSGLAFAVMVAPAVLGETALLVALPAAIRLRPLAVALAALAFAVVALNEFRVIALTTSDQASQRASLAVSALSAACPPTTTVVTKKGKASTTTVQAEGEGCRLAKASVPLARPELVAFQDFVEWASGWHPSPRDFDNWRSLLLVLFLNSGGLFIGLARR